MPIWAAEDIRDREMARIFNKALDKGIRLTAIFDTCHSGGTARGAEVGPRTVARMLAYDPRDIAEAPDVNSDGTPVIAPEDRKDNAALVLAATQVDQKAKELPDASPPHGVFTMALIDALQALPGQYSGESIFGSGCRSIWKCRASLISSQYSMEPSSGKSNLSSAGKREAARCVRQS